MKINTPALPTTDKEALEMMAHLSGKIAIAVQSIYMAKRLSGVGVIDAYTIALECHTKAFEARNDS